MEPCNPSQRSIVIFEEEVLLTDYIEVYDYMLSVVEGTKSKYQKERTQEYAALAPLSQRTN